MVKIQHKQSGEVREIGRHDWENRQEYKTMRKFWQVLDEGDPVVVFHRHDDGKTENLGLYDRDHAVNMIKIDSSKYYYDEVSEVAGQKEEPAEPVRIFRILEVAHRHSFITTSKDTPDEMERDIQKAASFGFLDNYKHGHYRLGREGHRVIELGSIELWLDEQKKRSQPSISVGGNAVIGNHNSAINQSRDLLNKESPIKNSAPQEAQPKQKQKSDHAIWDKIKYISVILGSIGSAIALLTVVGKSKGWW